MAKNNAYVADHDASGADNDAQSANNDTQTMALTLPTLTLTLATVPLTLTPIADSCPPEGRASARLAAPSSHAPSRHRDRLREINAAVETTIAISNHDVGGTATNTKARGDPAAGKMSFP